LEDILKIKLTPEMQKSFEFASKFLKRASKTGSIYRVKLMVATMGNLHLLIDSLEDENDTLQLEEAYEVLLRLSALEINK
jgi:hypothetical protein